MSGPVLGPSRPEASLETSWGGLGALSEGLQALLELSWGPLGLLLWLCTAF